VVAPDAKQIRQVQHTLHTFVRIRTVSDQVSQTPYGVEHPGVFEHCVQGIEVCMNVGDNQYPHSLSAEVYTGRMESATHGRKKYWAKIDKSSGEGGTRRLVWDYFTIAVGK
jgi:hypothetical protein